ncbi:GGH.2 family protein [Megaselia abdita]
MNSLVVFVITLWLTIHMPGSEGAENDRPIVGVLAQEISSFLSRTFTDKDYDSYIAASYIKFVEGAGARAVPVFINQPRSYYENLLNSLDGVLLPGGATFFNQSNGYADAAAHIYQIASEINDNGTYFPLWGTCLGFEVLLYVSNNNSEYRVDCASSSQSLPLEFTAGYETSRLFKNAPANVINILKNEDVTPNFHMYCATVDGLANSGLNNSWKVLSVNHDWNGLEFISTIEHVKYPFYAVQFHPEKNLYEFVKKKNISHSADAVTYAQYFADFFISEARKSTNNFPNDTVENDMLIYNYAPEFTSKLGSSFEQCYLFANNDHDSFESSENRVDEEFYSVYNV